jgi:hypothetical protein
MKGIFLLMASACGSLLADTLFVTNAASGTIGEYTTSGATVNASLISGLSDPVGIAVDGSNLSMSIPLEAARITTPM